MTQINVALKNQNRIQASVDLHQQAQKAQGKPHLGWKIFGAAVMALGVALIVAGVLLKTGIIDLLTFMPTSIAGPTVYAIGGTLCAAGCGFFYHGKQRGLSKSIDDLADRVRVTPNLS